MLADSIQFWEDLMALTGRSSPQPLLNQLVADVRV
jgi:hypothetical protein